MLCQLLFTNASYFCENIKFILSSVFSVSSHSLFFLSVFKDLINQGRQKVIEATNALKSVPREPLEDIIAQVVSDHFFKCQFTVSEPAETTRLICIHTCVLRAFLAVTK